MGILLLMEINQLIMKYLGLRYFSVNSYIVTIHSQDVPDYKTRLSIIIMYKVVISNITVTVTVTKRMNWIFFYQFQTYSKAAIKT